MRNKLKHASDSKFSGDLFLSFFQISFKILPIADWLKNKNAQKSLLTPEIKPHD
jgi:hypothetical protein